jgi:hypothetical protein
MPSGCKTGKSKQSVKIEETVTKEETKEPKR